jgi:hypothetical protein
MGEQDGMGLGCANPGQAVIQTWKLRGQRAQGWSCCVCATLLRRWIVHAIMVWFIDE